jgi:hypothetical protein
MKDTSPEEEKQIQVKIDILQRTLAEFEQDEVPTTMLNSIKDTEIYQKIMA